MKETIQKNFIKDEDTINASCDKEMKNIKEAVIEALGIRNLAILKRTSNKTL